MNEQQQRAAHAQSVPFLRDPATRPERVLVMGLGVHGGGLGVARWLMQQGIPLTITDMASAEALASPLAMLAETARETGVAVRYVLGEHRAEDFTSHAMVVANPAVPPDSPWLQQARAAGIPIETEMTLFFRACPAPIIGITGTKGKTTTTLLTGAILREQFPDTVVAGNLRVSALAALPRITATTPVVLELSSFQLVGLGEAGISPHYAAITNFSPDHLNYHRTMQAYAEAKQQIFLHQYQQTEAGISGAGTAILPTDLLDTFYPPTVAALRPASSLQTLDATPGATADCRIDRQGTLWWHTEPVLELGDIRIPGQHNIANVLVAVALARSYGVPQPVVQQAVRQFRGVEHRLELVRELDQVRYINDTTATNPVAAQAALHSFDAPIILLAGGAAKGLDTAAFAADIVRRAQAVVLLAGSATPQLQAEIAAAQQQQGSSMAVVGPFAVFEDAVRTARELAPAGGVVLLAPGCASFGMFRNEFHRGEEFRRIVAALEQHDSAGVARGSHPNNTS